MKIDSFILITVFRFLTMAMMRSATNAVTPVVYLRACPRSTILWSIKLKYTQFSPPICAQHAFSSTSAQCLRFFHRDSNLRIPVSNLERRLLLLRHKRKWWFIILCEIYPNSFPHTVNAESIYWKMCSEKKSPNEHSTYLLFRIVY